MLNTLEQLVAKMPIDGKNATARQARQRLKQYLAK